MVMDHTTSTGEQTPRKQAVRIQTSILNRAEKKALVWLAKRQPSWVTSDMLTMVGVVGAVLTGLGFALTMLSPAYLWLASAGLVVNWYGDSLDGTLARVRDTQRPLYGYYLDHNTDMLCQLAVFFGVGLSPWMHLSVAMLVMVAYLMLEVYVAINAHLKSEFKLTYAKLGPTELRLAIILVNAVIFFSPALQAIATPLTLFGKEVVLHVLDYVGIVLFVVMFLMYLVSFINDARYFAKLDPLKKHN